MNRVLLIGRLTKDPDVHASAEGDSTAMVSYTLAVRRRYSREGAPEADFIPCVTFQKNAEFAEKYFRKGLRVAIAGRLQIRSYTSQEGNRVSVTEVVVEEQEFADGKKAEGSGTAAAKEGAAGSAKESASEDGFLNIPEGIEEETPFS